MSIPPTLGCRSLPKNRSGRSSSSLSNKNAPPSNDGEFTPGPRFVGSCQPKSSCLSKRKDAQMSTPPDPPSVRSLLKKSQCPSRDSVGMLSSAPVLIGGFRGRGIGSSHEESSEARCETQMSKLPDRFEAK